MYRSNYYCLNVAKDAADYKQKNASYFIHDYNNDNRFSAGIAVVYKYKDYDEEKSKLILDKENCKDYNNFLVLMNKFEILAIGLKHHFYDKEMINDYFGDDLLKIYTQSKSLIAVIRKSGEMVGKDGKAFNKFE